MSPRLPVVWTLLVLVSLVAAPPARAQKPTRELAQRALGHYQEGVAAYRGGHYDEAIAAFNRAYDVDPAPILVFNIAQALWKKGDRGPALEAYRRYLTLDPAAPNRNQVESRIKELSAPVEAPPAPPAEPAPPPAPEPVVAPAPVAPPPLPPAPVLLPVAPAPSQVLVASKPEEVKPPFYRRGLFWSVVGAVAVGAVVAVALAARGGGGDHWSCADCNWSGARVR